MATVDSSLAELRLQFGSEASKLKRQCIQRIGIDARESAAVIRAQHEWLLFLTAYPDDPAVYDAAITALDRIAAVVSDRRALQSKLTDSGIHGTTTTCSYSYDAVRWLVDRFGRNVDLAWDDGSLGEALDAFLPNMCSRVEGDGLVTDRWTTQEWMRVARGPRDSDVDWLIRQIARISPEGPVRDALFDSLNLTINWRLDQNSSRTRCRFPPRPIFHHAEGLLRGGDWGDIVRTPLRPMRPLPLQKAASLIDVGRCTLLTRHRETDPMTHADQREVYLLNLDRGVDVAIFGMTPARRLPIESFFGYVAAKNRVPVAYGGGWVFGHRCEIGVNVFDTFRGGESAFVFAQILRAYRGMFDVREFRVDPYQFGADNPEAIRSGAFWFYHRFGFRPAEPPLARLAELEASRIAADRKYRSPASTLRRLAKSTLAWPLSPAPPMPDLHDVAMALTAKLGRDFNGDRAAAQQHSLKSARRTLSVKGESHWPREQRESFARMSVLIAALHGVKSWPTSDKQLLLRVMRDKGGPLERDYSRRLAGHSRLISALAELARRRAAESA